MCCHPSERPGPMCPGGGPGQFACRPLDRCRIDCANPCWHGVWRELTRCCRQHIQIPPGWPEMGHLLLLDSWTLQVISTRLAGFRLAMRSASHLDAVRGLCGALVSRRRGSRPWTPAGADYAGLRLRAVAVLVSEDACAGARWFGRVQHKLGHMQVIRGGRGEAPASAKVPQTRAMVV